MESSEMGMTLVFIAVGTFVWLSVMALACYCFYARRKRIRNLLRRSGGVAGVLRDEEEETSILPAVSDPSIHTAKNNGTPSANAVSATGHTHPAYGMARKLKNLGMAGIGFRTPLIRTRSVG